MCIVWCSLKDSINSFLYFHKHATFIYCVSRIILLHVPWLCAAHCGTSVRTAILAVIADFMYRLTHTREIIRWGVYICRTVCARLLICASKVFFMLNLFKISTMYRIVILLALPCSSRLGSWHHLKLWKERPPGIILTVALSNVTRGQVKKKVDANIMLHLCLIDVNVG